MKQECEEVIESMRHPEKSGIVVVPGSFSDEVAIGTLKSIWKQAQLEDE